MHPSIVHPSHFKSNSSTHYKSKLRKNLRSDIALNKLKIYSPELSFLQMPRAQNISKLCNFLREKNVEKSHSYNSFNKQVDVAIRFDK